MDQIKIGGFLKELRKEKGLTQEQLAEKMGVSSRTVSRWETGSNMPDLDVLILLADFYEVELREILDGERKGESMNKELEETVRKVADYSNEEKTRLARRFHALSWVGLLAFIAFILLEALGFADSSWTEAAAGLCAGLAFGMQIIAVIYTSRHMAKLRAFKLRLLHRQ